MTLDITQILFASSMDTFKNVLPNITGTLTVPGSSFSAAQTKTYTATETLDRDNMTIQTQANFSFDSSNYHLTRTTLDRSANFRVTFGFYINGDTITLLLVVWNADGVSGHTLTTFDVDYTIRQFAAPFD